VGAADLGVTDAPARRTNESGTRSARAPRTRAAAVTFGVLLGGTFVLILIVARQQWFKGDDWHFLAGRDGGDLRDLFRPHSLVHWYTAQILVYRALFRLFGLRTYLPYVTLTVALHLTVASLLRVIMRRAGVNPWIATVAALVFAVYGAGYANILWAFQMGFVGALALGLVHLLLASHDGPVDRRDWLGLSAGLIGLMCSGVAVTMVTVVGLVTLVQRGWRIAALHTAPLGGLYAAWWFGYAQSQRVYERDRGDPNLWARFVANGIAETFESLTRLPWLGVVLGGVVVVGLLLAWGPLDWETRRKRATMPAGLFVGAIVFLLIAALGRVAAALGDVGLVVLGTGEARTSRYIHVVAALVLPAIAVAIDAIAKRWRSLAPVVLVPLLVGLPGNTRLLADPPAAAFTEDFQHTYRRLVLSLPRVPVAAEVPRSIEPDPKRLFTVTIGWLRDGVRSGRIPDPGKITPREQADATVRLAFVQTTRPKRGCRPVNSPRAVFTLRKDDSIVVLSGLDLTVGEPLTPAQFAALDAAIVYVADDGTESRPLSISLILGPAMRATTGPVDVRVELGANSQTVRLCHG
jgi:hypothetical protein